ncbi:hypothetical protein [Nocardia yamanashiensis]|uniref:hypothetical protein n=1 Tax=Nocardia yamanashiensis TaxID=209247 RepID=UPI000AD7E286|nr:hypothetical protein [Nocardia yamanashiensis]
MKSRTFGRLAAIAGITCATAVLLAPPATAAYYVAPGVWCEGATCTNDNDETYLISAQVSCTTFNEPGTTPAFQTTSYPTSQWVDPHSSVTFDTSCGAPALEAGWSITSAVPRSQVPTGSVG